MGCFAAGCNVTTKPMLCGPHYRLVPVVLKRRLSCEGKAVLMEAIKAIAQKEGKMKLYRELEMAEDR